MIASLIRCGDDARLGMARTPPHGRVGIWCRVRGHAHVRPRWAHPRHLPLAPPRRRLFTPSSLQAPCPQVPRVRALRPPSRLALARGAGGARALGRRDPHHRPRRLCLRGHNGQTSPVHLAGAPACARRDPLSAPRPRGGTRHRPIRVCSPRARLSCAP